MIHCLLHVLMSGVHHRLVLTAGALRSEQKERVTVRCTVFFQFVCRSLALSFGCSLIGYHCVNSGSGAGETCHAMENDPWSEYRRRHASRAAPAQPPSPCLPMFANPANRQTFATAPDGNTGFSRSVFAAVGGTGSSGSDGNGVGQPASGPLFTGAFPFCAGQQGIPSSPAVGTQQFAGAPCMSPMRSAGCEQIPPMPSFYPQGVAGQCGPVPTMVPPPTSLGSATNAGFGPGVGVQSQQPANTGMPFGAAQFSQMLNQSVGQSWWSG